MVIKASSTTSTPGSPVAASGGKTTKTTKTTLQKTNSKEKGSFLTRYFLVILFLFALMSFLMNHQLAHQQQQQDGENSPLNNSPIGLHLKQHVVSGTFQQQKAQQPFEPLPVEYNGEYWKSAAAGLNCEPFGGPSQDDVLEMVYWEDIPQDALYTSPFKKEHRQFMTFEPDGGGWNNIRMAMESVLAMAFAMGRTLVLPPHQRMYLLHKTDGEQRNEFSFEHFFHMERIHQEHPGLDIISTEEFLRDYVLQGYFGNTNFPPNNQTNWNGDRHIHSLKMWMRKGLSNTVLTEWNPNKCLATFPQSNDPEDYQTLLKVQEDLQAWKPDHKTHEQFIGHPVGVNASTLDRLKENVAGRDQLCIYTPELQAVDWIHFPVMSTIDKTTKQKQESRLLVHFYAFLFFQDWRHDLWMKRFIRDHVRYIDEIQCAAGRIVRALRKRVEARGHDDFDTIHVRRGDFQYKVTRAEASEIYEMLTLQIPDGNTLYIATDERDKTFFDLLKTHYDVVFLDDVLDEIKGVNTNFYGMIDQLVASRGRIFYGCWFSTFTGYINRLRGYHHDDHKMPGYEQGIIPSYYYSLKDRYLHHQSYHPVKQSFYAREFPTSWRLIDTGIDP